MSSNARKSGHEVTKIEHEGKKAWKSCNVQFSGYDRTKIWAWEHEIVVNARKSEHERKEISWTHESLDLNAKKSEH